LSAQGCAGEAGGQIRIDKCLAAIKNGPSE